MNPLAYSVGGLLYSPASNPDIARHILGGSWPCLTSVCLCLEDSIQVSALPRAEAQLARTLNALNRARTSLPMVFVRVRDAEHLLRVHRLLGESEGVLTGYIFPKFDLGNAEAYLDALERVNEDAPGTIFGMPILESRPVARIATRQRQLAALRGIIDAHRERILNVRVGGNDFCNLFGLRRAVDQTIYDLGVVRDILSDIVNAFADDYVVSGPVWEYYGADGEGPWAEGLRRELALDFANGFFGKTAIHPSQLPVIRDGMKATAADVADARRILDWHDESLAVFGSADGGRMNEVNCHGRWAERVLLRARIYGVRE